MIEQKQIITGIDVGTTKIAVIIAELNNSKITIIGHGIAPSDGLEKGEVVDVLKTEKSLQKAISQAEEMAKHTVDSAFIGITGNHVQGINYSGVVIVNENTGAAIGDNDLEKVKERAQSINIPSERKILHVLNQNYKVDERNNIKNPKGLHARRLELNAHLVTIAKNSENDLKNCLSDNIQVEDFVLEPLASAYAVLSKQQKELGTVLIDIGGGTTDVIIYKNNGVQHSGAISMGGNIITKDIALGIQQKLGICLDDNLVEKIKHDYGSAKKECIDQNKIINLNIENNNITLHEFELANIIQSRITEIFHEVQLEINKSNINQDSYGIVITGGGSQLKNILDLGQEVFQKNIIIGFPSNITADNDLIKNPRFSTAIGLIQYGLEHLKDNDITELTIANIFKDLFKKLKKLYNKWY